jgi:hypothetical protein
VKEYDIYIPLTYNDGSPVEARTIERIGEVLLKQFEVSRFFPKQAKAFGKWVKLFSKIRLSCFES